MSEQFTTPEQALIERLGRAPQPELSQEARDAIHARILIAFENPPAPAPRPYLPRKLLWVAILVVGALIASGILFVLSQQPPAPPSVSPTAPATTIPATPIPAVISSPVPEATSTATPTLSPTFTSTATLTLSPTFTSTATLTLSPTFTSTATLTLSPTFTSTPTIMATVTATVSTITVIQGPIQDINDNVVTVYDIPVQLAPDDPVLPDLVVGDEVRIEGNTQTVDGQIVIVGITIIVINVDVNTGSSTGTVWQDDGTCANPPPDWAPANGWRQRCQSQNNTGNQNPPPSNPSNDDNDDNDDSDD